MQKKIKVGIPRAFLYYRHNVLWKTFFENLNCNIILSPETNKEIIDLGKKYSIDESCLSSKIYMGHVAYLVDKCDYVLVPRICNYGKNNNVCVRFNALYDIVKNLFPMVNVLNYNIEKTKLKGEFIGFIKMGLNINKNIFKVIYSYIIAKIKEKKHNDMLINKQRNILKNNKLKILIVAHPYNIYDKYIGEPIIKFLKSMNIELLYADLLDRKTAIEYSYELSNTLYWTYSKELVGAVNYYKNAVVAVEDHRFYDHGAIDIIAIGRAIFIIFKQWDFVEGGSTITQQTAKNLYFIEDTDVVSRKVAEIILGFQMEKEYSKDQILELYINTIYFGDGYYGIKEACEGYLGKAPQDMTLYDATMLAGIPNAPSAYAPTVNFEYTCSRQKKVVSSMAEYGYLSEDEANDLYKQIDESTYPIE